MFDAFIVIIFGIFFLLNFVFFLLLILAIINLFRGSTDSESFNNFRTATECKFTRRMTILIVGISYGSQNEYRTGYGL